jgi:hypothetical protein
MLATVLNIALVFLIFAAIIDLVMLITMGVACLVHDHRHRSDRLPPQQREFPITSTLADRDHPLHVLGGQHFDPLPSEIEAALPPEYTRRAAR